MAVITIARQMGSMGDKLGRDLAERLGYDFLNKEIIRQVAQRTGSAEEDVAQYDERADGAFVRFLSEIFVAHPEMASYYSTFAHVEPTYAYGVTEPYVFYEPPAGEARPVDPRKIVKDFEEIVREVAGQGNVVIIGRASQCILKDLPDAMHVRVIAPIEWRVRNVMRDNPDLSRQDAEDLIRRIDKGRERYLGANYSAHWENPLLYHMVICVDRWDWTGLLEMLMGFIRAVGPRKQA